MHYISKIFSSSAKPKAAEVDDVLEKLMPEAMQEEMFCFTMGGCELHQLKHRKAAKGSILQAKECVFMKASIHVTSMLIDDDEAAGTKVNIPVVVVSNDSYEDD